jgi:hypothetical protein
MPTRSAVVCACLMAWLGGAATAHAQYGIRPAGNRATGENYHVEITGNLWGPAPSLLITSESIEGIPGTPIDFVEDLGIEKSWVRQLKVVARAAEKHKFRFEYTPIRYEAEATLQRNLVFNGILFPIAVEVESDLVWRAFRFAYEYDFVYRDRGFVGLVLETKYTHVEATLTNRSDSEFIRARAPIPAIGVIGRGYVAPNIAITGEFTFFKVPDIDEDYGGRYFDFDLYGTVNFTENVGAQGGFRSFDVVYKVENDDGDLTIKGLYFGGVVRF